MIMRGNSSVFSTLFAFCTAALYMQQQVQVVMANDSAMNEPFSSSYSSLDHAPCVTLFHRNGRLGCGTSSRSIQKGLVQYFDGSSMKSQNGEPYVAVIEDYMLKADTFDTLLASSGSSGLLQGVLVLNSTASSSSNDNGDSSNNNKDDVDHRSPDSVYPQGYGTPSQNVNYGYYKYPWNGRGENLFYNYDLHGIPMAFAKNADVSTTIRQAAKDQSSSAANSNNNGNSNSNAATESKIVAEFNYYMGQEQMTSAECLLWKDVGTNEWSPKCLPLGGTSVWAAAGSPPADSSSSSNNNNGNNKRPIVLVGAGTDSTSLFHDISPGANTAASSILTLIMAAKILGENVNDQTLDALNNQIVFGLFAGETYGFVGSRNFLRDVSYPGFECYDEGDSPVRSVPRLGEKSPLACLNPLYPSVKFSNLGAITGMIAVDQVGVVTTDNFLYVHADQNNDKFGYFLANVLKASGTSSFSVVATSAEANNNYGYPYPPSPLTSLLSLSQGAAGGAVLTGYDYAYTTHSPYHSHVASSSIHEMNYKAIAAAATIVARSALAAAYDGGDYDYETASAYALNLIPNELSYQDETLLKLGDCLFYNGECDMIKNYATVTAETERSLTGFNLGTGASLGVPPNYYAGVYNGLYGQPFVQVGDNIYGRYDGKDFGKKHSDAISLQPRALENAIHGMMNDFLGRGTANFAKKSCQSSSDCSDVSFCVNNGDTPTCTGGGVCVCRRAYFHAALDEALMPAKNQYTGMFEVNANDAGNSPIYTEPYWSNSVGVRVYRDAGQLPGLLTLAAGAVVAGLSFCAAFVLRVGLKKEKLY